MHHFKLRTYWKITKPETFEETEELLQLYKRTACGYLHLLGPAAIYFGSRVFPDLAHQRGFEVRLCVIPITDNFTRARKKK